MLESLKAIVTAIVGAIATFVMLKWKFQIPTDLANTVVSLIMGALGGVVTWVTPNIKPPST